MKLSIASLGLLALFAFAVPNVAAQERPGSSCRKGEACRCEKGKQGKCRGGKCDCGECKKGGKCQGGKCGHGKGKKGGKCQGGKCGHGKGHGKMKGRSCGREGNRSTMADLVVR